ncbi:glycosyl hydrolase 5 family protein [Trifolium repens]|nr:glycosyl hydrolase 5 family protein [Trifolium repens]
MIAEGLNRIPLKELIIQLKELGFNCVRYTWATHMFTRYSTYKVGETFDKLNLHGTRLGIGFYNPSLENVTVVDAFDFIIDEFGKQGMMVLADNHVSDPKWCCDNNDGNGFFGDQHFDPLEWLEGLSNVANRVKGKPQVVAIGMRNELRGPNQDKNNWYKYMSQGATTVHKANPNVLVFVSGLNYDTDLSFLKTKPLNVSIGNKLVYEVHSYAWSNGSPNDWNEQPVNQKCANVMNGLNDKAGFLMSGSNPSPLVMKTSSNSTNSYIIYHPLSGQCVKVNNNNELELGDCDGQSKWNRDGQQIKLVGSGTCIEAISVGSIVKLSNDCKSKQSFWKTLSATNLHLGTLDGKGQNLCLQRESSTSPKVVTKKCICVDDNPTCLNDPQSQWFQLVTTNV